MVQSMFTPSRIVVYQQQSIQNHPIVLNPKQLQIVR